MKRFRQNRLSKNVLTAVDLLVSLLYSNVCTSFAEIQLSQKYFTTNWCALSFAVIIMGISVHKTKYILII